MSSRIQQNRLQTQGKMNSSKGNTGQDRSAPNKRRPERTLLPGSKSSRIEQRTLSPGRVTPSKRFTGQDRRALSPGPESHERCLSPDSRTSSNEHRNLSPGRVSPSKRYTGRDQRQLSPKPGKKYDRDLSSEFKTLSAEQRSFSPGRSVLSKRNTGQDHQKDMKEVELNAVKSRISYFGSQKENPPRRNQSVTEFEPIENEEEFMESENESIFSDDNDQMHAYMQNNLEDIKSYEDEIQPNSPSDMNMALAFKVDQSFMKTLCENNEQNAPQKLILDNSEFRFFG